MRHFLTTLISRTQFIYVSLVVVWGLIVAWQVVEHQRVKTSARAALINRSQDITTTLGLVVRSQRRFGGIVGQERLESALMELVRAGELNSVALVNATGGVVASAGPPIDLENKAMMQTGEHWDHKGVTLVNLLDLGATPDERGETNRPTIILPRRDPVQGPREEGGEPPRLEFRMDDAASSNVRLREPPPRLSNGVATAGGPVFTNRSERGPGDRGRRAGPGRPPWMGEQEYKELIERRGLHGLVIAMSTDAFRQTCTQDIWMRFVIACFAGVSVVGLGLAWRNLVTSSELQMRLLRASEMNTHLKQMNLAAAGLAHETRNPLNIIRGLAQMISKQQDASTEVRGKTREIIDETDRVTAQLNEFINYSRPREVRRAALPLSLVVGEVVRALSYDVEEKCIRLQVPGELPVIEADEQLLRQALFNLLLNAVQAVQRGGDIEVAAWKDGSSEAVLEIRDNGPGVAPEQRVEIFKPYFTTHQKGTGLGLAVVQQIVLAHGWEIECVAHEPKGAIFRVRHLKLATKS